MEAADEVIAVLFDNEQDSAIEHIDPESTTCLIRSASGVMRLQKADSMAELERTAETSGIFKRGVPILDPNTGDVIGYELERIDHLLKAAP